MSDPRSSAYMAGYRAGRASGQSDLDAVIRAKNTVIVNLSDTSSRLMQQVKELEEVNAVLQQNVDELTARMPPKPEPSNFQVGDEVRHKQTGSVYTIAAINPTTQQAMFSGFRDVGWFPLAAFTRVEA